MEKLMKVVKIEKVEHLIALAIVVVTVIAVAMWGVKKMKKMKEAKKEHLDNVSDLPIPPAKVIEVVPKEEKHEMETKETDVPIKPQMFDAGSGTIIAGPEFVPSQYLSPWYQAYTGNMKNYYLLDDGADGAAGLHFNMCSKSCCSEQYPLPFKMPVDSAVCKNKADFVPNNYMCNNAWQDTGCVCMSKEQAGFLGSRGGNA